MRAQAHTLTYARAQHKYMHTLAHEHTCTLIHSTHMPMHTLTSVCKCTDAPTHAHAQHMYTHMHRHSTHTGNKYYEVLIPENSEAHMYFSLFLIFDVFQNKKFKKKLMVNDF